MKRKKETHDPVESELPERVAGLNNEWAMPPAWAWDGRGRIAPDAVISLLMNFNSTLLEFVRDNAGLLAVHRLKDGEMVEVRAALQEMNNAMLKVKIALAEYIAQEYESFIARKGLE